MGRTIICGLLIFAFLTTPGTVHSVTMDAFLQQVQDTHPFFKKESLSSDIERKKQEQFLGDKDWTVRSTPYYAHQESVSAGFTPDRVDQVGLNASIGRTYWETGGQLSLAYDYVRSDQNADDIIIPSTGGFATIPGESGIFYDNEFSIAYSHPLMKNKDGVLSRLGHELQDYSIEATSLDMIENKENFLQNVGDLFLNWTLITEQRRILYKRLELAKEELERTEKKRKQNLVDEVDVLRARVSVLNAKQRVLEAEAGWKAGQAELASIAQYENHENIAPQYDLYQLVSLPPVDDAISQLKQKSRVLHVFKVRIDQLKHRIKGVEEQGKPQLDLNISGGMKSRDGTYSESYDLDNPQFKALLNFSYPLGNRTSRADILRTKLEKERLQEDMKNVSLNLESSLRNLMIRIKELEKVLALNKEQVMVAKEKTGAEIRRYNQGRIELTFVIQSRDNEQNIQMVHAQNGAVYHKLLLRYRALMDRLLSTGL
jgi:outer membrane protein TolC